MPITTVSNCKAFRNIPGDQTDHDAELVRLIEAAQGFLEKECGRAFDVGTVTEYHSGNEWRDRLMLARPPIASVTNIWQDPARVFGLDVLPIDSRYYTIDDAEAGVVKLDGFTFGKGLRNIKVTYVGGFVSIPADLEEAAIELIWAAHEKGQSNLVGVRSRAVGDGSVQYVNLGWPLDLGPIVDKYKLQAGLG